jgi:hypothetical protein
MRVRRSSSHKNQVCLNRVTRRGKFRFGPDPGGDKERWPVLTVTVAIAASVPSRVSEAGDTEQVALRGAPLQPNVTLALNPKDGVTVKV